MRNSYVYESLHTCLMIHNTHSNYVRARYANIWMIKTKYSAGFFKAF